MILSTLFDGSSSLSSWRAWIEMSGVYCTPNRISVALLMESVD